MHVIARNTGQSFEFDDIAAQVLARYDEGKTPALVVKSALQLGFSPEVIMQLPGITPEAFAAGQLLISSGAFPATATGTPADGNSGVPDMNSLQALARFAAGLDPYGLPPAEVALLRAAGSYVEPPQLAPDQIFVRELWAHVVAGGQIGPGLAQGYHIAPGALVAAIKSVPPLLDAVIQLMDQGMSGAQFWDYVKSAAPEIAVELVGVAEPGASI